MDDDTPDDDEARIECYKAIFAACKALCLAAAEEGLRRLRRSIANEPDDAVARDLRAKQRNIEALVAEVRATEYPAKCPRA